MSRNIRKIETCLNTNPQINGVTRNYTCKNTCKKIIIQHILLIKLIIQNPYFLKDLLINNFDRKVIVTIYELI